MQRTILPHKELRHHGSNQTLPDSALPLQGEMRTGSIAIAVCFAHVALSFHRQGHLGFQSLENENPAWRLPLFGDWPGDRAANHERELDRRHSSASKFLASLPRLFAIFFALCE